MKLPHRDDGRDIGPVQLDGLDLEVERDEREDQALHICLDQRA